MMGKVAKNIGLPTLIHENTKYESTEEKANLLVKNYTKVSSTSNYSTKFVEEKNKLEDKEYNKLLQFYKDNSASYNEPFSLQELKDAVHDTHDTSLMTHHLEKIELLIPCLKASQINLYL